MKLRIPRNQPFENLMVNTDLKEYFLTRHDQVFILVLFYNKFFFFIFLFEAIYMILMLLQFSPKFCHFTLVFIKLIWLFAIIKY